MVKQMETYGLENTMSIFEEMISEITKENYKDQINKILDKYQFFQDKISISKISKRREYGIYYTNYDIAYKITEKTLKYNTKNINEVNFYEPCSGLGIFIITYIDYIVKNFELTNEQLINVFNNIYFSDIDNSAILIAKKLISKFIQIRTDIVYIFSNNNIYIGNVLINNKFEIQNIEVLFNKKIKFDIVLTNPPYRNLKASTKEFMDSELEQFKNYYKKLSISIRKKLRLQQGTINLYKVFVEQIFKDYTSHDACIGLIIPSTILSDYTSTLLRKEIFYNSIVEKITILSEGSKEFKDVSQSMCYFGLKKAQNFINKNIEIIDENCSNSFENINLSDIANIDSNFTIAKISHKKYKILNKIHLYPKLKDISEIVNLRGELDLTLNKKYIQNKETKYNLLQGKSINEWSFLENNIYVDEKFIVENKTPKTKYIENERLICQQISNIKSKKRLKFSKIPKNYILGNSCNFIAVDNDNIDLDFLLAIFNSYLMDWRFKLFSSNNHINNYELDDLPINLNPIFIKKIKKCVHDILNGNYDKTIDLNILIFKLYDLDSEDILELLLNYNDKYANELKKRYSK